jgi:hypothetical protein
LFLRLQTDSIVPWLVQCKKSSNIAGVRHTEFICFKAKFCRLEVYVLYEKTNDDLSTESRTSQCSGSEDTDFGTC